MDILRQVANSISRTAKQTGHNIDRVQENFPLTERVSDFLNAADPLEMEFKTYHKDQRVTINAKIFDRVIGTPTPCGDCGGPPGSGGPTGCTDALCGVTDTWTRAISEGYGVQWSYADAGTKWIRDDLFWGMDLVSAPYLKYYTENGWGVGKIATHNNNWVTSSQKMALPQSQNDVTVTVKCAFNNTGTDYETGVMQATMYLYNGDFESEPGFEFENYAGAYITLKPIYYGNGWILTVGIRKTTGSWTSAGLSIGPSATLYVDKNEPFYLKLHATPNYVEGKVWREGEAEPAYMTTAYAETANDYKNIMLYGQVQDYVDYDYWFYWDNLDIVGVNKCSKGQFETFNRSLDNGTWGISTFGKPWGNTFSNSDPYLTINGAQGVFSVPPSVTGHSQVYIQADSSDNAPWTDGSFDLYTRFRVSSVLPEAMTYNILFTEDNPGIYGPDISLIVSSSNGAVYVQASNHQTGSYQGKTDWTIGWYLLRVNSQPGSLLRWKLWKEGTNEPVNWDGELSDTGGPTLQSNNTQIVVDMYQEFGSGNTLYVDYIEFDYPSKVCFFANIELVMMTDTTGSMNLGTAKNIMNAVFPQLVEFVPGLRYALAEGHNRVDTGADENDWYVWIPMTDDFQSVLDTIPSLGSYTIGGGGGTGVTEPWGFWLYEIANDYAPGDSWPELGNFIPSPALGFRGASKKLVILIEDEPNNHPDYGNSPWGYPTHGLNNQDIDDVIAALIGADVSVIVADVSGANDRGDAVRVAVESGGAYIYRYDYTTDQDFYDAIVTTAQDWMSIYLNA